MLALEGGRLSFTLSPMAAEASLGWLEKELGTTDLKPKIESGEQVVAFDVPIDGVKVDWPLTLGKVGLRVHLPERKWVVSLDYPSGGAIWQTLNIVKGRKKAGAWRVALAAAGAR